MLQYAADNNACSYCTQDNFTSDPEIHNVIRKGAIMPDSRNILKICAILAAGAVSLAAAAYFTESYAAEVSVREKTLAEAIMQNQLAEELKKAEEQAQRELEEQGETLAAAVMETKPPVTEPPETETSDEASSEAADVTTAVTAISETETTAAEEEIITEFTRGGLLPADRTGIPVRTMFGLNSQEQEQVTNFLVRHYFLDGFVYSDMETRPKLKEKKLLAAQMESSVVKSLNLIMDSVNTGDISAMLSADYGALKAEAEAIKNEFEEKYSGSEAYGEQYASLYEDSLKYFDRLITALGNVENTANQYANAANPLLALGLLTSSVNDVIVPEIMAVLEQSFDLVETSQEIFLEGTQGTVLLTRDEVRDIIANPALVLNTGVE